MWFVFLSDLKGFLQDSLPDASVFGGISGTKAPQYPAYYIIRGYEPVVEVHRQLNGTCVLIVEVWEKTTGVDPMEAYEILRTAEEAFMTALVAWSKAIVTRLGIAAKVSVISIKGDGEKYRPRIASQIRLQIEWRKTN